MAWTVDVAFVHAFEATIYTLSQEMGEMWRSAVRIRSGIKGKTFNVERLQGVEAVQILSRHADTDLTPFIHTRRRLTLADFGLSEMIDDIDEVKMLISPENDYARNFAYAYNRQTALTITTAMLGSALSVSAADAVTSVALPSGQAIANGGTNMTIAKLRQAYRILDVNGVRTEGRHIAVSPFAIEKLLSDSQVTSADFSSLQALMTGTIKEGAIYMGFQWLKVTDALGGGTTMASPILPKSGNIRTCIAWQRDAVTANLARDFNTEMVRDPGKWNNLRIIVKFVQGAVRVEDEAVVSIGIDESA
jgi:hypothetical protein